MESSIRGQSQSLERSYDSNRMMSSSNLQHQNSMQDSKKSDISSSEEDSRVDSDAKEKKKVKKEKGLTEADLENEVKISFVETDTFLMLHIPSYVVQQENQTLHQYYQKKNPEYEKLLASKAGRDNFTERSAQTFNYAQKPKEVSTQRVEKNEIAIQESEWNIFDTQNQERLTFLESMQSDIKRVVDQQLDALEKVNSCYLPTGISSINAYVKAGEAAKVVQNRSRNTNANNTRSRNVADKTDGEAVSYTHLTLPTIYSV
eukprot:TRINITY_DN5922_c0_g1_i1.p1 TRINITY_DN5922_c0_g1~~TRINITY_DN5922_c0_g1_i1.p1  ORF type:complete len:260 (-),score=60.72 TRINITY_DN5922_c0_g1_i1:60-839(-)